MLRACGHSPSYSGKFIARAVELYLNGVKPGYIRWHELQNTLEKEFPSELKIKGQDRPSPETVLDWVRRRPDAPERLKQLRVQQLAPDRVMPGLTLAQTAQPWPAPLVPKTSTMTRPDINGLFGWLMTLLMAIVMARCVGSALSN
jgi:hypothetical protein